MSTEFNPSTFEHEGIDFQATAQPNSNALCSCQGCFFDAKDTCEFALPCTSGLRPDGKNIIWVRAQEGKKA